MPTQSSTTALAAAASARVRRPLAIKIVLMVLLFVIPLVGVTIYFLLKGPNKDIEFAALEKKGDAYLKPLERLLDAVPRRQLAAGNAQASTQAEAEIDAAFTALADVQTRLGTELQFTVDGLAKSKRSSADPAAIKNLWESVRRATPGDKDTDAKFDQLTNAIGDAITHAGDKSNLILDPDLDSYYLMDATINTMPQISRRIATLGLLLKSSEALDNDTRRQLAVFAAQIGDDIAAIRSKFDTVYAEDPNFYGSSPTLRSNTQVALGDAGRSVDKLLELLKATNTSTDTKAAAPEAKVTVAAADVNDASAAAAADSTDAATAKATADTAKAAAESKAALAALTKAAADARASLSQLWGKSVGELDTLLQMRIASLSGTRLTGLLTTLGLLLGASLIAFFILRTITRPVAALSNAVALVAAGDESARAPIVSQDEIGQLAGAFNTMVVDRASARQALQDENTRLQANIQQLLLVVADASDGNLGVRAKVTEGALGNVADALNLMFENVGDLIKSAKSVSERVNNAATNINTAATDLSASSEKQALQLEGASAGARNVAQEAKEVAEACRAATAAAEAATNAADRGAKVVREVITGMEQIRESVQVNGKKIKRLGERSMEIGGILKTINEISAQTDMLALNASIEAGRAGEAGRGFSAVAEQVRGLAERAKAATQQIEKLVGDIQQETAEAVAQVEGQTHQVEAGAQKVALAGEALNDIVHVASQSRSAVTTISATAARQATKTGEMLEAVSNATVIATESRGKVAGAQTTSEQLAKLSQNLDKQLSQFQIAA